jgi:hypothetical protein
VRSSEEQLLSDFDAWAAKRGRPADTMLLGVLLTTRAEQQHRGPTLWAAGDVALAVAGTLAARPDLVLPGVAGLEATLDSFFRFLRNTGRLMRGSAEFGVLRKEARREGRSLAELLRAFAETVDHEAVDEEIEYELLDPDDPRHETIGLLRDMGIRTTDLTDVNVRWWWPLPSIERSAEQGMSTGYLQRLQRLPELVTPELQMEDGLIPRPADAWRIASELALEEEILADADPRLSRESLTPVIVQRSCAFHNWWLAAYCNGLVDIQDGIASPGAQPSRVREQSATRQLMFASRVARGRLVDLCETGCEYWSSVIHLVVGSLLDDRGWCSLPDSASFAVRRQRGRGADESDVQAAGESLERAVDALVEAGVVERDGALARVTDFGAWVVDDWIEEQFKELLDAMSGMTS